MTRAHIVILSVVYCITSASFCHAMQPSNYTIFAKNIENEQEAISVDPATLETLKNESATIRDLLQTQEVIATKQIPLLNFDKEAVESFLHFFIDFKKLGIEIEKKLQTKTIDELIDILNISGYLDTENFSLLLIDTLAKKIILSLEENLGTMRHQIIQKKRKFEALSQDFLQDLVGQDGSLQKIAIPAFKATLKSKITDLFLPAAFQAFPMAKTTIALPLSTDQQVFSAPTGNRIAVVSPNVEESKNLRITIWDIPLKKGFIEPQIIYNTEVPLLAQESSLEFKLGRFSEDSDTFCAIFSSEKNNFWIIATFNINTHERKTIKIHKKAPNAKFNITFSPNATKAIIAQILPESQEIIQPYIIDIAHQKILGFMESKGLYVAHPAKDIVFNIDSALLKVWKNVWLGNPEVVGIYPLVGIINQAGISDDSIGFFSSTESTAFLALLDLQALQLHHLPGSDFIPQPTLSYNIINNSDITNTLLVSKTILGHTHDQINVWDKKTLRLQHTLHIPRLIHTPAMPEPMISKYILYKATADARFITQLDIKPLLLGKNAIRATTYQIATGKIIEQFTYYVHNLKQSNLRSSSSALFAAIDYEGLQTIQTKLALYLSLPLAFINIFAKHERQLSLEQVVGVATSILAAKQYAGIMLRELDPALYDSLPQPLQDLID